MKTHQATIFEVGMRIVWIDAIPNEDGFELLTTEQIQESVSDRHKEISMASSRVYTASVRLLEKLKRKNGPGPFTVTRVSTEFVSNDTCHPQNIKIDAMSRLISGYWFKLAE